MSPQLIGIIGLAILLVIIFLGVQVGLAMALIGFVGVWLIVGFSTALARLYLVPFQNLIDPPACPAFIRSNE